MNITVSSLNVPRQAAAHEIVNGMWKDYSSCFDTIFPERLIENILFMDNIETLFDEMAERWYMLTIIRKEVEKHVEYNENNEVEDIVYKGTYEMLGTISVVQDYFKPLFDAAWTKYGIQIVNDEYLKNMNTKVLAKFDIIERIVGIDEDGQCDFVRLQILVIQRFMKTVGKLIKVIQLVNEQL